MYCHLPPSRSVSIATTIFEINIEQPRYLKNQDIYTCNWISLPASLIRDTSSVIISEYELLSSHDMVMLMSAYL